MGLVNRNLKWVIVTAAMGLALGLPTLSAAAGSPVPQERGFFVEVKAWARVQWRTLKAYWNGAPTSQRIPAQANPVAALPVAPAPPVAAKLVAPPQVQKSKSNTEKKAEPIFEDRAYVEVPGLKKSGNGVPVYDLGSTPRIPRLSIGTEERLSVANYRLDTRMQKIADDRVITAFESPPLLPTEERKQLTLVREFAKAAIETKDVVFSPKGRVSREAFDKIAMNMKPEAKIDLGKFKFLTPEELRFLSGLLLYQQGNKCAMAIGLFHQLSKSPGWQSEANYYLASCSRKLGLMTDFYDRATRVFDSQDVYDSLKLVKEIGFDVPYEFTESLGTALAKVAKDPKFLAKLESSEKANVAYILTDYGAVTERFKTTLAWAKEVPASHPKYLNAQFLLALAEYQAGSKTEAFRIQDQLIGDTKTDKTKLEFQALVALNLGRMAFQERDFKKARESFQQVYKDHPLWLQSLTEMGWAQLMSEDFEGAIGNMYSIQSPFFANVYKPESYVIRTVGYLNLCQYGDAYKTLSHLEHDYRPQLEKIETFVSSNTKKDYYETVKHFLRAPKDAVEIDGLPTTIVREMARHRDFTNLQKSLNRQIDERPKYDVIEGEVDRSLKRAQAQVNVARKNVEVLKTRFATAKKRPELENNGFARQLEKELANLNDLFFAVDLSTDAKNAMPAYKSDVIGGADKRLDTLRAKTQQTLANRLLKMKVELTRMLDNNELLRYEVFAGSGENIRYQVAGGEVEKRIPANVLPKSKSLHWDFDGEYWEDEIGHYRSSLKNNCPHASGQKTASNEGVEK